MNSEKSATKKKEKELAPVPEKQAYLSYKGEGQARVLGVGDFTELTEPIPVAASIANQFDNDELKGRGWIVTRG